eukprot:354461-Chlamydomonas_euryale.AAC.5
MNAPGCTDAKSAGAVSCTCTKLCRLEWRTATACRAAHLVSAPHWSWAKKGKLQKGGRSGQEAALGSGERGAWPTRTCRMHL